ncbi:MAG TPA: MBL fold metallo-hydrolase [Dehalococcoidia bacterium]|nr:MBL fold metallo-hydrolase [Dehalococcoidia bacterium]
MDIILPGAHNLESCDTGFTCLVVDDVLAIDAGGLSTNLSFTAQQNLKAILLTHHHYDHIKDLPAIAMNFYVSGNTVSVYGTREVYNELTSHLFDGKLYPNFMERPPEKPTVRFIEVEPYRSFKIDDYEVLPVPVKHGVPAVGYQITSPDGQAIFYTGDTGPSLEECWQHVAPRLLIVEVTMPNELEEVAVEAGHLTPALLKQEMLVFQKHNGYLPRIVTVHMNPEMQEEIETQLQEVAEALGHPVTPGYEGMRLKL